jgi:hypothetical protein
MFYVPRSRIFHLHGYVTITGEGLQNLCLCSALEAFDHGGIFNVLHLLWQRASVFPVSSEGPPHSIASYDSQENAEDLFLPGSSQVPIQSPLTMRKGVLRTYSYPCPHGSKSVLVFPSSHQDTAMRIVSIASLSTCIFHHINLFPLKTLTFWDKLHLHDCTSYGEIHLREL